MYYMVFGRIEMVAQRKKKKQCLLFSPFFFAVRRKSSVCRHLARTSHVGPCSVAFSLGFPLLFSLSSSPGRPVVRLMPKVYPFIRTRILAYRLEDEEWKFDWRLGTEL
jgi:hypothetical protein